MYRIAFGLVFMVIFGVIGLGIYLVIDSSSLPSVHLEQRIDRDGREMIPHDFNHDGKITGDIEMGS